MLALISDIHGNLPALQCVLEELENSGVEIILCAGDLVGYNPWPNEVIWEIRRRNIPCIRGNHDRAVIMDEYSRFNPYAAIAARWSREALTEENMQYLISLRDSMILEHSGYRISVHHGAPFDEDFYVYPEDATEKLLEYDTPDILVLGHTHVPFVKEYPRGVIINPGSVGQPRDGDPRAAYALVDVKRRIYKIKRVPYDIDKVADAIYRTGLPSFLAQRLYLGY